MRTPCIASRSTMVAAIICLLLAAPGTAAQQGRPPSAEYSQGLQFTNLGNMPIAGLLERGAFEIDLRMYPDGGLFSFVTIGLFQSMNVGLSYGADNVVGRGKVDWNPNVEAAVKLRIISETVNLPAVAVGYATQGYGPWLGEDDQQRYMVKSPGLYAVASKNWRFLFELGTHFGINKSLEKDDDSDLNFFGGIDVSLSPELYLLIEYDTALNDNDDEALGYGNGYLNFGVKWAATPRLRLELIFTNLLEEIRIVYTDWF